MYRRPPRPSASDIPSAEESNPSLEPDYLLTDSDDSDDTGSVISDNLEAELNSGADPCNTANLNRNLDHNWAALRTGDPDFGPPMAAVSSEKKIRDGCKNQSSFLVTPTVGNVVKPFYKPQSIKTISNATLRQSLKPDRVPSASSLQLLTPQWRVAKKVEQQTALTGVKRGHTTGNRGDLELYKVNDFVIYEDEKYPKIIKFGKVIRVQVHTGSDNSIAGHCLHLHLYQHSQQSFLQELGQPDELYQVLEYEDINSKQVLGTCTVGEAPKPGNSQSPGKTAFDFICRFAIVSGKSKHAAFTDLSTTDSFCRSCSKSSQSLQDIIICRNGDTVHKGDCVHLCPEGQVAGKGLCIVAIVRSRPLL